jgi:hypothetical protein
MLVMTVTPSKLQYMEQYIMMKQIDKVQNQCPLETNSRENESQYLLTEGHTYGMLESLLMQHFDGGTFQLYM